MRLPDISITDDPSPAALQFLEDRINEFNFAATGFYDGRSLAALINDPLGHLAAGLYGWTWGGCAEVRFLWVREDWRGQGLGRELLAAAEAEAVRRGCQQIVLSTHTFQAPEFYLKQGYTIVGRYENYPRGFQQLFLTKNLTGKIKMDKENLDKEKLDGLIDQVHSELDKADSLDEGARTAVRSLTSAIKASPAPLGDPSLTERLQSSMTQFETTHPLLAQAISQVLSALAETGV